MEPKVCAVMVTHDAGSSPLHVARTLMPQVDGLVVVDNDSDAVSREHLRTLQESYADRVELILNDRNAWMAAALNQGIDHAREHGFTHVLFSSDSDVLSPHAVSAMLSVFRDPTYGLVGSVNPRVVLGRTPVETPGTERAHDVALPVTGGCLLALSAVEAVGSQREDFLIDLVDFDYGIRLQQAGFRTLGLDSVSLAGELGRTTRRRFLWRHCAVFNYSPARQYYFARNGLTLVRETRNRALTSFYVRFLVTGVAKVVLYEDHKAAKLAAVATGLLDSLRGRLGPRGGRGSASSERRAR